MSISVIIVGWHNYDFGDVWGEIWSYETNNVKGKRRDGNGKKQNFLMFG